MDTTSIASPSPLDTDTMEDAPPDFTSHNDNHHIMDSETMMPSTTTAADHYNDDELPWEDVHFSHRQVSTDMNQSSTSSLPSHSTATTLNNFDVTMEATNGSTSISNATSSSSTTHPNHRLTGRPGIILYVSCDGMNLSPFQVLVRQQMELFEATAEEVEATMQGRNKPIVLGQVGLRCIHCKHLPPRQRSRGAVYYPSKLEGLYQAGQNMATIHLCDTCPRIPLELKTELIFLKEQKTVAGGGKVHWAHAGGNLGVYEDEDGLRFKPKLYDGGPILLG
jgi:hypothetical protein